MRCPIGILACHRETEERCPTKMGNGQNACSLGDTSIPVRTGEGFTVYELKAKDDGAVSVRLSLTHRSYIKFLAERGGETPFDYGKLAENRDEIKRHLKDLIDMGLMTEMPILGRDEVHHRLTEMGRNVATSILKQQG